MIMLKRRRTTPQHERAKAADPSTPGDDGSRQGRVLTRSASVLAWASGVGFGAPGIYAIWHLARHGDIARFMGYPTYGEGVFDRKFGVRTTVPLLSAFALACAAECRAGWLLWNRQRSGGILALALLPVESVFWIGFSLPLGPVAGAARTALVLTGWPSLKAKPPQQPRRLRRRDPDAMP